MHEALYKPAQTISAKLTGASAELAKQLRYISMLDNPSVAAAVGAGDADEEQSLIGRWLKKKEQPRATENDAVLYNLLQQQELSQDTEYLNINIKPDERSAAELAQGFDYEGMYVPIKFVKPSWQPKTLSDIYNNLKNDFGMGGRNFGISAHGSYLPLTLLAATGEFLEWGMSNLSYGISSIEGASQTQT